MTLDQKLERAAHDAHRRVSNLDVPSLGSPRMGPAVVLAATLVVVAMLGGLGLLIGTLADSSPVVTRPTVTTAPGGLFQPEVDSSAFFDLAVTPAGLIATDGLGLWISQDGYTWVRHPREVVSFPGSGFTRIAASELGVIVVDGEGRQAWFSPDGQTWEAVGVLAESLSINWTAVAASAEGFVVFPNAGDDAVMFSTDGMEWEAIEIGDTDPAAPTYRSSFTRSADDTPSGFVAVRKGRIWVSPNGLAWNPAELNPADFHDVAGSALGAAAVAGRGEIWFSSDGRTWRQTATIQAETDNPWVVAASDTGFLTATMVLDPQGEEIPTAWFSPNGASWTPITFKNPRPPQGDIGNFVRKAIAADDRFFLVGEGGPIWVYEP